ncbi:MAG: DUF488 family protein, N3 subclade [Opitutaceae bacterium]
MTSAEPLGRACGPPDVVHGAVFPARSQVARPSFARKYKAEMAAPAAKHDLALLAALSKTTDFSVGCYCESEARCHRSLLKQLLLENGAKLA